MHLEELSIAGFKSFAKKSELKFAAPITAIVGPNGSGKSNVAESFRFVLGEQSVKSMRGKRGEDLIWGGSEKVSRGNRASVSVTLNNDSRVFPLDVDRIIVERTVHRDGQNEYIINGAKVRLKDVQELLAAANIGSTGHHIISQGEADRILSANERERREMIEDALGLKVFQYKKQDAEKKLEKTKSNIEQVQSLRREVAPHLKYLEKQVKRIEKSVELQSQLKTVYAEYLKREDMYIAFHHDRLTHARKTPISRLEALQDELIKAKDTLQKTEATTQSRELEEIEQKLNSIRQERTTLLREVGQIEGQTGYLANRIKRAVEKSAQKKELPVPYHEAATAIAAIEKEVAEASKSNDVAIMSRVLSNIIHKLKLLLERSQTSPKKNTDEDETELKKLERELEEKKARLKTVQGAEEEVLHQYNALQQSLKQDESAGREAERQVFALMNEQRDIDIEIEAIDRDLRVLERDREEFKRELQEAVALIGSATGEYFKFVILDGEGNEISKEEIVNESREQQRQRRHDLEKLKIRLEEMGVGATDDVMKEYQDAKDRDEFLAREITDLEESVGKLESLISDLNEKLNEQFVAGLEKISAEFNRFFVLMFGGGEAALKRVKPKVKKADDDVEEAGEEQVKEHEEGIELDVKLPNKRVKGLEMLSGGERALTSIALIFAMSQVNPPLFIILDETDAALDEANSRRYGDMIEALAEKSQLILITHNRETMSRAGILYGVTMGADGVSKLLSVKFDEAVAVAK